MKELRPGSSGATEIRLIFAFDPRREAIILIASDKAGAWTQWYHHAIPLADDRYTAHLTRLAEQQDAEQDQPTATPDRPPPAGKRRPRHTKQEDG